ncbi:MAG: hypothetical protein ACKO3A_04725 [Opitutia bacterium]
MSNEESQPGPETAEQRRQLSADATLGLERLVVGRECNAFDRLPPDRKARAFAELIRLRLVYGKVQPVAGRSYPDVTIQRVSRRGVKSVRKMRLVTDRPDRRHVGWNLFLVALFLSVVTLVLFLVLKR